MTGAVWKRALVAVLFPLFAAASVHAKEAPPMAADPAVEERMLKLSEELRCLVCQNETLAASRADLAEDLRNEVRRLIKEGKTDQQVKEYLVARYGDFVLYKPPVKGTTWLLWFGPFVFLAGGVALLIRFLKRRDRKVAAAPLSDEERRRAEALLNDKGSQA